MSDEIRILHVEDEPDFADLVATFLESENEQFQISTAQSASDGLEQLVAAEFDCIVSDYNMPGQDGIEFLETLRDDYPNLPFILFTAKGSEEVASDAITAGATDYIQKGSGTDRYELLANRITNAVKQYRATQRATELDRIRTLASAVNQALVRADSRAEAETRICDIISDAEPYLFAWIGEVDSDTGRIEPRVSAGIEDEYLDTITVTADETATGQGPAGTAIRERRIAVSQNIADDPTFQPWRDDALERGYQAVAAVPLEYEETLYGELVVYADRPQAFDADERDLLSELGDDIAHGFHSFDVQEQLRTERDRRQALFENAPGPVVAAEIRDGGDAHTVTAVNDAFEEVFGYETETIVGTDPAEFLVPEEKSAHHEEIRERANTGETFVTEVDRNTTDGSRTFLLQIIPYGLDDRPADGLYAWYTDIFERSEREEAIEKLHQATNKFMEATAPETIADIATNAVAEVLNMPTNGVHLYDESEGGLVPVAWTEQTEAIVGEPPTFAPGEGLAGRAFETGDPQIYDDISTVADRFNPDTPIRSQIIFPLADHGVLVIGSSEPDAFDDTDVSLAEMVAAHMTTALDEVERERELKNEQRFIKQSLNALDSLFYVLDADGTIRRWNDRVLEVTGYTESELDGMHASEIFPENQQERIADAISQTLSDGHATVKADLQTADTNRLPYEWTGARLTDTEGNTTGLVGIGRDLTERRRRERRFQALVESSNDMISVVDTDGTFQYQSPSVERILGYDSETMVGDTAWDYIHPEDREAVVTQFEEWIENPTETPDLIEYRAKHADGSWCWLESHANDQTENPTVHGYVINSRDITQKKQREQQLNEERERYTTLFETLPTPVLHAKPEDNEPVVQTVNPAFEDVFGCDVESIRGDRVHEYIVPEDKTTDADQLNQRIMTEGEAQTEVQRKTTDGERTFQLNVQTRDTQSGGIEGYAVYTDITERKEYGQKLKEQRDNLELLNQVVRHDIRNNLQVIRGRTDLLKEYVDQSGQNQINTIQRCTRSAIELTSTARDLSETMLSTEADIEPVRLDQHLNSVINDARSEFDDAIITVENPIPNSIVSGNELLEGVFWNLVQNAVVHNDKETPQIQLSVTVADETLTVAVADNGPGIPDNQKEEIFGKGEKGLESPGTGIGLYLVQTLVDQYGGDVWIEDNNPDGSVFVVELPIADAEQG